MADEKGYAYVVLAKLPDATYRSLGVHQGRTPEEAIVAAADEYGLPVESGGDVAAIPSSKFHHRHVKSRTEKVHEVVAQKKAPEAETVDDAVIAVDDKPGP